MRKLVYMKQDSSLKGMGLTGTTKGTVTTSVVVITTTAGTEEDDLPTTAEVLEVHRAMVVLPMVTMDLKTRAKASPRKTRMRIVLRL